MISRGAAQVGAEVGSVAENPRNHCDRELALQVRGSLSDGSLSCGNGSADPRIRMKMSTCSGLARSHEGPIRIFGLQQLSTFLRGVGLTVRNPCSPATLAAGCARLELDAPPFRGRQGGWGPAVLRVTVQQMPGEHGELAGHGHRGDLTPSARPCSFMKGA